MVRIKDLPKHKRPREKLLEKGSENLNDAELLAILIRTGRSGKSALDIAKEILKKFSLSNLSSISQNDLDKTKVATIQSALELGKRVVHSYHDSLPIIDSAQKAVDQLADIAGKHKEYFAVLYLNARKQLLHRETISIGTINATLVHPREVFEPAIRYHAAAVILAHNHPSQSLEASNEDLEITRQLKEAGEILDIEMLDHIIVTSTGYMSFLEKGLL